jgi:hypothetical protein
MCSTTTMSEAPQSILLLAGLSLISSSTSFGLTICTTPSSRSLSLHPRPMSYCSLQVHPPMSRCLIETTVAEVLVQLQALLLTATGSLIDHLRFSHPGCCHPQSLMLSWLASNSESEIGYANQSFHFCSVKRCRSPGCVYRLRFPRRAHMFLIDSSGLVIGVTCTDLRSLGTVCSSLLQNTMS